MSSLPTLEPAAVRELLRAGRELAFIDLREAGPHGRSKPLFAVNLPLGRLEERIFSLVPRRSVPVILFDGGLGLVRRGAERLNALGYTNITAVGGTLADWRRAGGELFRDTSVASKAFGEVVEQQAGTPEIDAAELKARLDRGENLVVIDDRPFAEYQAATIPGSVNIPGAELVLRAAELLRTPDTQLVIHCAGRTRSLIGTQALINAGIFKNVVGLRHGNIGWNLAGLELEHGAARRAPARLDPENHRRAREAARDLAQQTGVRFFGTDTLAAWEAESEQRTLYKFDVRSPEEHAARHAPGFAHAAGGQLVQATDEYIGVLSSRVVLADDDGVRAVLTASWLRQLGWSEVAVLADGLGDRLVPGPAAAPVRPRPPETPFIDADTLAAAPSGTAGLKLVVVDLRPGRDFAAGHIPGAWYVPRARAAEGLPALPDADRLVLVSEDGYLAAFAQAEFQELTVARVEVLAGGFAAWQAAGHPLEKGLIRLAVPPDDVYRRPLEETGNPDDFKSHYIAWELGLPEQIRRDGTARFDVHQPARVRP
ncbi:Rhodanese-related sulfurtransferase [Opitutaceae bacterium TAV1]|nr:Rhodanese-related sulfurtransferase [Opitutaceae bacterium TAV1]